jgi:hypothetical protein
VFYWFEMCDAVSAQTYEIAGIEKRSQETADADSREKTRRQIQQKFAHARSHRRRER